MEAAASFNSEKVLLSHLLEDVKLGRTQLPDFQRGWVWDDDHIKSLLASVSLSYPIGAVMLLQTGNADVRFKPRTIEGVDAAATRLPDHLILDGQQRLTSLFQVLASGKPVATWDARGHRTRRWYYLRIDVALDPTADREDAIMSVPEDRFVRNFRGEAIFDYSNVDRECRNGVFPLSIAFDPVAQTSWMMRFVQQDAAKSAEFMNTWNELLTRVLLRFQQYQIPVIELGKATPKEAVCQVFEKVNTGGVSLTVFELLTATFAADDYSLRDDWDERKVRLHKKHVLQSIESSDFLQVVSLLETWDKRRVAADRGTPNERVPAVSCKRRDILRLELAAYKRWADAAVEGLEAAARFLASNHVFDARDVPYRTQIIPLAAILAVLGSRGDDAGVRRMLVRWYWCGVFGELYGSAIETRFAKDLPSVLAWVDGGPDPDTVLEARFSQQRLANLQTRNSAAYKGIFAKLMVCGARDFRSGDTTDIQRYFDDHIDIHHVFPQDWCRRNAIPPSLCDSIVNKTPLSARTNRMIGGRAPSDYLNRMQSGARIGSSEMDSVLLTHLIDPATLRADEFQSFFAVRERALLDQIAAAIGKPVDMSIEPDDADDYSSPTYETLQEVGPDTPA